MVFFNIEESFLKHFYLYLFMSNLFGLELTGYNSLIIILIAVLLMVIVFKFLSGVIRIIVTLAILGVIAYVVYSIYSGNTVLGRAIYSFLSSFIFVRCKNGYFQYVQEKKE